MNKGNSELGSITEDEKQALPRRLSSSELFGNEKQVLIQHGVAEYLLRITRQGKLILTK